MPTPTVDDLDTAIAAFDKARDTLSKAQDAVKASKNANTIAALTKAQAEYKDAGQSVRRAKDPTRALDILEFNRYLTEKARIKRQRQGRAVMGRD